MLAGGAAEVAGGRFTAIAHGVPAVTQDPGYDALPGAEVISCDGGGPGSRLEVVDA
jgi:hypothetical protein